MDFEKIAAIKNLLDTNEEAAKKLEGIKDIEQVCEILKEFDISVTKEEFASLAESLSNGELSPEMLELIAGGGKVRDFIWGWCDGAKSTAKEALNTLKGFLSIFK